MTEDKEQSPSFPQAMTRQAMIDDEAMMAWVVKYYPWAINAGELSVKEDVRT